jgi:hypothetical protein
VLRFLRLKAPYSQLGNVQDLMIPTRQSLGLNELTFFCRPHEVSNPDCRHAAV